MQDKLEILSEIKGFRNLVEEQFKNNEEHHDNILEQVKKTNGRTTNLEIWQARIIGGLIVSQVIILPVLFVIIKNWLEGK